jgi:hypothetical protein
MPHHAFSIFCSAHKTFYHSLYFFTCHDACSTSTLSTVPSSQFPSKVHELDIATREALKQAARDATA